MFYIADIPDFPIIRIFDECIEFIDTALKTGKILVHCAAGVSRSASVVIAYIMKKNNLSYEDASFMVRQKRPMISPKFFVQLKLWKNINFDLKGTSKDNETVNKLYKNNTTYKK